MISQARAAATRQKIIDVSIELFGKDGFSATSLNKILRRAGITAGAFYYHFDSKETLALAIIEQVEPRMTDLRQAFVGTAESGLENVIAMTFELSRLMDGDLSFWVAAYLEQTMVRLTREGVDGVTERVAVFVDDIARAVRRSDLREGVSPEEAARTILTLIYGCYVMAGIIAGDTTERLAECWRILLLGLVPAGALPHFEQILIANLGVKET